MGKLNYELQNVADRHCTVLANKNYIATVKTDYNSNPSDLSHAVHVIKRSETESDADLAERICELAKHGTITNFAYTPSCGYVVSSTANTFVNGEHQYFKAEYDPAGDVTLRKALTGISNTDGVIPEVKLLCADYAVNTYAEPFTLFADMNEFQLTIKTDIYNNTPAVFNIDFYIDHPTFSNNMPAELWFDFSINMELEEKDQHLVDPETGHTCTSLTKSLVHICKNAQEDMINIKNIKPTAYELYAFDANKGMFNWINEDSIAAIPCSEKDFANFAKIISDIFTQCADVIPPELSMIWGDVIETAKLHFADKAKQKCKQ